MKEKNYTFEFLRIIFTLGVVVGHTYCFFFLGKGDQFRTINFHASCVDFFFLLSGLLMAISLKIDIFNADERPSYSDYLKYNTKRFFRLLPLMIVAAAFGIFSDIIIFNRIQLHKWPTFFMLAGINNFDGWGPTWYISALFWGGLIISGILCFGKKKAVYLYFPIIIFLTISFLRQYGCVNESYFPIVFNFLSAGMIKALLCLTIGVESYYLNQYVQKYFYVVKPWFVKVVSISVEFFYIILILYLMFHQIPNDAEFLSYIITPLLFVVILSGNSIIFSFVNNKFWGICAKPCSLIYITHPTLIVILINKKFLRGGGKLFSSIFNRICWFHYIRNRYIFC